MNKMKEWLKEWLKEKRHRIAALAGLLVIIAGIIAIFLLMGGDEEVVYKESQAEVGLLAVGVTETGSVDVGTTTQSFELDISEYTGESSLNLENVPSGMNSMGGVNMMGVMNNGNQTASSSSGTLKIEEVYIKPGVEVTEDTPLLKLSKESVESIRSLLAEDAAGAQIVYEQMQTADKKTKTEAEGDYKINTLYAEYLQVEYEQTIQTLQTAVEEAQETLTEKEEALAEANEELAQNEVLLAEQKKVLENAEYTEAGTDKRENLYWWIVAWETKESAREMVETLEEEIENLGENIATCEKEVTDASTQLSLAQKNLELGKIEAESQWALRSYNGKNAQEIYDVAISQGEFELKKAREDYEEAKDKLEEFDTQIIEQIVYASGSGLVTDVYVAAGDTLTQNTDLISMNDYDEVTVTLSIEEEDMEDVRVGNPVNVTAAAFSEEVFTGEVAEIGDAEIDSNTNKTLYSVTVSIKNTGDILYQDMTAEVTFLTDDTMEVLYVPNRAIFQEGEKDYVLVKDENGKQQKRQVVTGFSDGVNTEIKEGLSEGETVLWESRVRQS